MQDESDCSAENRANKNISTPDLRVWSAILWQIVNTNYGSLFPSAVDYVSKIFQAIPQIMPVSRITDIIMDLKIKAVLARMESKQNETFDDRKVLSLLDQLFPSTGDVALPGMCDKEKENFLERHRVIRNILNELRASKALRENYMSDFLHYYTCDCHVKVIEEEVKELIDLVEKSIESTFTDKMRLVVTEAKPLCTEEETEIPRMSPPEKDNSVASSSSEHNCFDQSSSDNISSPNIDRKTKENVFKPMTLPLKRKHSEGTISLKLHKKAKHRKEESTTKENIKATPLSFAPEMEQDGERIW